MVYSSQHSLAKFKDIDEFKELPLDSMFKRLNNFIKWFNRFKTVKKQQQQQQKKKKKKKPDNNEVLKQDFLGDVRDLFKELYYIFKDKYSGEKIA